MKSKLCLLLLICYQSTGFPMEGIMKDLKYEPLKDKNVAIQERLTFLKTYIALAFDLANANEYITLTHAIENNLQLLSDKVEQESRSAKEKNQKNFLKRVMLKFSPIILFSSALSLALDDEWVAAGCTLSAACSLQGFFAYKLPPIEHHSWEKTINEFTEVAICAPYILPFEIWAIAEAHIKNKARDVRMFAMKAVSVPLATLFLHRLLGPHETLLQSVNDGAMLAATLMLSCSGIKDLVDYQKSNEKTFFEFLYNSWRRKI